MPHVAAAGAVSLDAVNGVQQGDLRGHGLAQVDEQVAERVDGGLEAVPFRLFEAGDAAKEVFDPGGHHRQPVGFELGAVDDVIGLQNGRNQRKAVAPAAGNIQIERSSPSSGERPQAA